MQISHSGWLSTDDLFFLMKIFAVFFWNCELSELCILYTKKVPAPYLFHGIIFIFQHEEKHCKCKGAQRGVRLLTCILTKVLICTVCFSVAQFLNQNFKNTNVWLWIIQLRNQHRRDKKELKLIQKEGKSGLFMSAEELDVI